MDSDVKSAALSREELKFEDISDASSEDVAVAAEVAASAGEEA